MGLNSIPQEMIGFMTSQADKELWSGLFSDSCNVQAARKLTAGIAQGETVGY